jgi:hypothetical protein
VGRALFVCIEPGLDFSISAAIGFISLFGVSVMSGILIINAYYRIAASGMTPIDAMFQAVSSQMRPILMMTLLTCIGLSPAALSTGIGSQVQRPACHCNCRRHAHWSSPVSNRRAGVTDFLYSRKTIRRGSIRARRDVIHAAS